MISEDKTLINSFQLAKDAMADACLLTHLGLDAHLALCTDALDVGVHAVLEQLVVGRWHPFAFTS